MCVAACEHSLGCEALAELAVPAGPPRAAGWGLAQGIVEEQTQNFCLAP